MDNRSATTGWLLCALPMTPLRAGLMVGAGVMFLVVLAVILSPGADRKSAYFAVALASVWALLVFLASWYGRRHPSVILSLRDENILEVVCCPLHPAGILQWPRKLSLDLKAIDRIWVGIARDVLSLADVDGGGWRYGLFESRSFPVSTIMVLQRKGDGAYYYVRNFSHLTNTQDLLAALEQHGVTVVRV